MNRDESREPASLENLRTRIAKCDQCSAHLPLGPRPLLAVSRRVRVLVIGQAPGRQAHMRGVPWDDKSGDRLRAWLGLTRERFYSASELGLMPMGFCFPGSSTSGDLAPRTECAAMWHEALLAQMPRLRLTILIGKYAQDAYLPNEGAPTVTEAVRGWASTFPQFLALPHPSPRNNRWLKVNPWFATEILPMLQAEVARLIPIRQPEGRHQAEAPGHRISRG